MMDQERAFFKAEGQFSQLLDSIKAASQNGETIDRVEKDIWQGLLDLGQTLLQESIEQQGTGDLGPTFESEGKTYRRLDKKYVKRYVSVFGEIQIVRTVYGTREGQKHERVPLDARLNLPEGDFSFLLQDWAQELCAKNAYKEASTTLARILGLGQTVRSLEYMSGAMAQDVETFRDEQPMPNPEEEGSILVFTADGKGVPMRRDKAAESGRRKRGEKSNKKRQACVGAAYTIDPFPRQAEDVVDEIFREEQTKKRPAPCHKRLRAELTRDIHGVEINGKAQIFQWFEDEAKTRNADGKRAVVCVMDGDRALWNKAKEYGWDTIGILDIYHVMERLWDAAYCFHAEGSDGAEDFVKTRLQRILEGQVGRVLGGLKQMGNNQQLRGAKKKQLEAVITYLQNNREYMRYDYYLEFGYPIGSGVVEGACRHLVKDRMEGTGMRWRTEGAQSMLNLRSVLLNDDWEAFQEHRIQQNVQKLYPYREIIQEAWKQAA